MPRRPTAPLVPSPARLDAAARWSFANGGLSFVAYQRGRLRREIYAAGVDGDTPQPARSIVKSLWALGAAAAVGDGLLAWDEPVAATLAAWRDGSAREHITVRDLLSMTSGLDPSAEALYDDDLEDGHAVAIAAPLLDPRGTFRYGPAAWEALGALLAARLGPRGETPDAWLQRRLLGPARIVVHRWITDRAGHRMMSAGARLGARSLLRAGRLLARRGRLRGRPMIDPAALAELTRPTRGADAYGLGLWLNAAAAGPDPVEVRIDRDLAGPRRRIEWRRTCLSHRAPPDLVAMIGSGGMRVYAVPSLALVIVRQGDGPFDDAAFLGALFTPAS